MAVAGTGSLLKIGDGGGPESFTTIAEVTDISGPGGTTNMIDVTSHDANGYTKQIPGLKTVGDVTFDIFFNAGATQGFASRLYLDWVNKTKRNFQIVIPTTSPKTGSFAAYVSGWDPSFPVDGAITVSVTITVDGSVTWA